MIDLSLRYDTLVDAKYALGVLENAAGSKSKIYETHTSGAREVDSLNMLIGISASVIAVSGGSYLILKSDRRSNMRLALALIGREVPTHWK